MIKLFAQILILLSVLTSNVVNADTFACEVVGAIGNVFDDVIADLGNVAVAGTSEDVPPPYDEFIIVNIQPPDFNGCNVTIRIDIMFTSALNPSFDSTGFADVKGRWDLSELCNLKFCIDGLKVDQIELSNEPEVLEKFAEDYVNSKLDDPECKSLLGDDEDEDEDEDEDNGGDEVEDEGGDNDNGTDEDNGVLPFV